MSIETEIEVRANDERDLFLVSCQIQEYLKIIKATAILIREPEIKTIEGEGSAE